MTFRGQRHRWRHGSHVSQRIILRYISRCKDLLSSVPLLEVSWLLFIHSGLSKSHGAEKTNREKRYVQCVTHLTGMLYYPLLFEKVHKCYIQQNHQNEICITCHTLHHISETTHEQPWHAGPWKRVAKGQQLLRLRGHGERSASCGFRSS